MWGNMEYQGVLSKMATSHKTDTSEVSYTLRLDAQDCVDMNACVGQEVQLIFENKIHCVNCGRNIPKTFNNGYCFPCSQCLAECDICMVRPEKCHHSSRTCRDEQYAESQCFQSHTLYLARSDVIKVGITREWNRFHRWMDQGAVQAMPIAVLPSRRDVGLAEVAIAQVLSDKANWRKMLKGDINRDPFNFYLVQAQKLLNEEQKFFLLDEMLVYDFEYPVQSYPEKVQSVKLDKILQIKGVLTGIKAQYLMFGDQVINLRSHAGYCVRFVK